MQKKIEKMEEPEYVVVARSLDEDAERIELPTDQDNMLGLQTLVGAFPGAHGLKYKNPMTGAFRALLIDNAGAKFHPPSDGWSNKVFVVLSQTQQITQEKPSSNLKNQTRKSDQNAKRRKLMVESDEADSCDSDTEPDGKTRPEAAIKRQQVATKQKRMMGNNSSGKSTADADEEDEELPRKIVDVLVLGLPFELTEDQLRNHFETFGKVVHCEVKTQKGSTGNRGFGFVQMVDLESQDKVLKNKIHNIGGRDCPVKIPFTKNALSSKVFVGRIKEGTTSIELKDFFTNEAHKIDPESSVTDVYIPRPFRSFAFVTFSSPAVAKELIKKSHMTIGDTAIYVANAHSTRPTTQHDASNNQIQQFQQNRSNSFQMTIATPQQQQQQLQNQYTAEEMFKNECYGHEQKDPNPSNNIQNFTGFQPNRIAGPMFLASNYQHQPPPPLPIYAGTPPAVVAGSQMLNQLETLNLNNMGIGHEVVNAIKAIFSVAQTATTTAQQPQSSQMLVQKQHMNPVPSPYQSLSSPIAPNGGSSPGRVYVPPNAQSSTTTNNYQQQRRRNGGSGNNSGGSAWRH